MVPLMMQTVVETKANMTPSQNLVMMGDQILKERRKLMGKAVVACKPQNGFDIQQSGGKSSELDDETAEIYSQLWEEGKNASDWVIPVNRHENGFFKLNLEG